MKIYTKTGDKGTTALFGGKRLPKHHARIEAYGTVDELNALIGYALWAIGEDEKEAENVLREVQDRLFTIGSNLASEPGKKVVTPELNAEDVEKMENEMDRMGEVLPPLKNFVLPGGSQANSILHLARCVCRRAERRVTALQEISEVNPLIIKYLNRLSDYLFVLSRWMSYKGEYEEIYWKPRQRS